MDGVGCPKEDSYTTRGNMKTSDADTRQRVNNSPSEQPKADKNITPSKRLQAAQAMVELDRRAGLCKGTDDDLESMELYISDCAAVDDDVDAVLDKAIEELEAIHKKEAEESSGRNAA